MSQMRKRPKLTKEIFERYIEKYLFNPPSKMDEIEVEYYQSQFLGIMKNITRDFTKEQFVNFYQNPMDFINIIYNTFGLTRKGNYILFVYNTARISFLQERGLNPKFEINDFFKSHIFDDKFWTFRVIKKNKFDGFFNYSYVGFIKGVSETYTFFILLLSQL